MLVGLSMAKGLFAQWKQVAQFPVPARSIYFLDQLGHPEIGFVGLDNGELWQTPDSGKTWTLAFTDPLGVSISDINFKNRSQGWFVTKAISGQKNFGSVFMTTDGGASWNLELQDGGSFAAIYYHAPTNLLFLSVWERGGLSSSDDGNTWTRFTDQQCCNGFAFSNDNDGIMSFCQGAQYSLCTTHDGGLNWQLLTISPSASWQPAAKNGTSSFFMFSEYTATLTRSDDYGATWIPKRSLPTSPGGVDNLVATGCLRITSCNQFFTQTPVDGFYTSTDEGMNWKQIGGPTNNADTRFWVNENVVFGSDFQGGLWAYPSVPPTISVSAELNIFPSGEQSRVRPGENVVLAFSVSDTIRDLDSMNFDLRMASTLLNLDSANAPSGWKIVVRKTQPGIWNCTFHNIAHSDITPYSALAFFYFSSFVATDNVAGISIKDGNIFLDPQRPSGCSQVAMTSTGTSFTEDSVTVITSDSCADKMLRGFLSSGNIDIKIISIRPNPASNEILIETESSSSQEVSAMIYDDLGKIYLSRRPYLQGKMNLKLSIVPLPAGTYHLMLKSASGSASSDFVKLH
jgi:hypothetical protein